MHISTLNSKNVRSLANYVQNAQQNEHNIRTRAYVDDYIMRTSAPAYTHTHIISPISKHSRTETYM